MKKFILTAVLTALAMPCAARNIDSIAIIRETNPVLMDSTRPIPRTEYGKYSLQKLNEHFTPDNEYLDDASFYIAKEIAFYPDIRSLIIQLMSEFELNTWLVNYDLQHNYIEAVLVGFDEWAESADFVNSVIRLGPEPSIEREAVQGYSGLQENTRIEVLRSGRFRIVEANTIQRHEPWF